MYNGIVIFGDIGSGKSTLATLLKGIITSSEIFNLGDLCRDIMKISSVNEVWNGRERELGQEVAEKLRMVDKNILNDYVYASFYNRLSIGNPKVCPVQGVQEQSFLFPIIVGGRTKDDLMYWKEKGFYILGIMADNSKKMERVTFRNSENNSVHTQEHFTEKEARDIVLNYCDSCIENNKSMHELESNAREIIHELEKQLCNLES